MTEVGTSAARLATGAEDRIERWSGLPGRYVIPAIALSVFQSLALVGVYWDIAVHIDDGRDASPFTWPHLLILIGLNGIVASAMLHAAIPGPRASCERRLPGGLSFAPGAVVILVCGLVAVLAFPLDQIWHSMFGEDLSVWGATHLFMIGICSRLAS